MGTLYVSKNVKIHVYFSTLEGVYKHKSLGNTALGCHRRNSEVAECLMICQVVEVVVQLCSVCHELLRFQLQLYPEYAR